MRFVMSFIVFFMITKVGQIIYIHYVGRVQSHK
jgi:hypothetical protein